MSYAAKRYDFYDKPADYARVGRELTALLARECDLIANAANTSALLFDVLPEVNLAGSCFLKDSGLVVGPFEGKPACVRITLRHGVCGTAAAQRLTLAVPDVRQFPGHTAASRSEIVVSAGRPLACCWEYSTSIARAWSVSTWPIPGYRGARGDFHRECRAGAALAAGVRQERWSNGGGCLELR